MFIPNIDLISPIALKIGELAEKGVTKKSFFVKISIFDHFVPFIAILPAYQSRSGVSLLKKVRFWS